MEPPPVTYLLDADDIIVRAGGAWNDFAAANGGPTAAEVAGRPIWAFIAGEETAQLWRHLLARARDGGPVEVSIRCDAPDLQRTVRLMLTPEGSGGLAIVSRALSENRRQAIPLFDARAERTADLLRVCSWCHAVALDGRWVPVEQAADARGWLTGGQVPVITHSICNACLGVMAMI